MHRRTITAAITVLAALTLGAPAATAQPIEPVAAKACDLGFMPLKPTVTGPAVLGNVWAKCDAPPEQHRMTYGLERREGGAWVTAITMRDDRIPAPRVVYEVSAPCVPGLWRVFATAGGSLGGTPFTFTDFSIERFVTADDCARGR